MYFLINLALLSDQGLPPQCTMKPDTPYVRGWGIKQDGVVSVDLSPVCLSWFIGWVGVEMCALTTF